MVTTRKRAVQTKNKAMPQLQDKKKLRLPPAQPAVLTQSVRLIGRHCDDRVLPHRIFLKVCHCIHLRNKTIIID
jgi:hypothetical protein